MLLLHHYTPSSLGVHDVSLVWSDLRGHLSRGHPLRGTKGWTEVVRRRLVPGTSSHVTLLVGPSHVCRDVWARPVHYAPAGIRALDCREPQTSVCRPGPSED